MIDHNANLGGFFDTSHEAAEIAHAAHCAAAMFVNARDESEVFFGQSMTALTFTMARNIGQLFSAGDDIVLTRMDHDANIAPWLMLATEMGLNVRWLDFDPMTYEFDLAQLRDLMSARTKLIAVCLASNVTGTINDVASIARIAREFGSLVYVDAVQFAAHAAIDVQALDCDFLVCSAYKFYGPHCAIFWGRAELLNRLTPSKVRPAPEKLPWRFCTGTANLEGIAGTHAAIDYIGALGTQAQNRSEQLPARANLLAGFDSMRHHDDALASRLIGGLQGISKTRILGIVHPDAMNRRVATVSFLIDGLAPAQIAQFLAEQGIQVWNGHNYAIELYRALGLLERGGAVRIGPVHYNTLEEIDRTIAALKCLAREPARAISGIAAA